MLQAVAVFYYVPLLFGDKWTNATLVVAILCLSAATKSWQDLSAQLLRAAGMPGTELAASCVFTLVFIVFFALGLQFGLLAGVGVLTISTLSMQTLLAAWARRQVNLHADMTSPEVTTTSTRG